MANLITNRNAPNSPTVQVSNGGMAVLISVLLLSGSDLATTAWEQTLMTWLAEHDQGVFGLGMVGFDIDEIAWQPQQFLHQRAFVLRMIDRAIVRHRWEVLGYDPPFVHEYLQVLRQQVEQYPADGRALAKQWQWRAEPTGFSKCPVHQVYMHAHGCAICNDQ